MLKMGGRGKRDGKEIEIMIVGLSHGNLKKLKEGKPISCNARDFGCTADIEMLIFSGTTEQAMAREMIDLVGPETMITVDPRIRD